MVVEAQPRKELGLHFSAWAQYGAEERKGELEALGTPLAMVVPVHELVKAIIKSWLFNRWP